MSGGSNERGFAQLDQWMEFLESLPEVPEQAAPVVKDKLVKLIEENIAAERNPYGDKWAERKPPHRGHDTPLGPLLANAGKALKPEVKGTLILIALEGVEVMHHVGNARGYRGGSKALGGYRRTILPIGSLPGPFRGAIRTALEEKFQHLKHTYGNNL